MSPGELLQHIEAEPFFALIEARYRGKVAKRSGVSYTNHIREGAVILFLLYGYDEELTAAYCLHPLFQSDRSLVSTLADDQALQTVGTRVSLLCMEYRRVANAYTISDKVREADEIEIGPLEPVHRMLVADKIQNKKDFMKYMYGKHDRRSYERVSLRAVQYFDSWLSRLRITEDVYRRVVSQLEETAFHCGSP